MSHSRKHLLVDAGRCFLSLAVLLATLQPLPAASAPKRGACPALETEFERSEVPAFLEPAFDNGESIGEAELGVGRKEMVEQFRLDKRVAWIIDDLLENNLAFATNHSEESRDGIAQNGFLNQYQTGRSSGEVYDPKLRRMIEARYLGVSDATYSRIPVKQRAKYGYLAPYPGGELQRNREVQGYGSDVYILKKDRLQKRTTWVAGDSLDGFRRSGSKLRRFMLWRDRDLLLPHLVNGDFDVSIVDMSSKPVTLSNGKQVNKSHGADQTYIELEFWDEVTLDDVESFVFKNTPPKGKFLKELRKRDIKIFHCVPDKKNPNIYEDKPWKG